MRVSSIDDYSIFLIFYLHTRQLLLNGDVIIYFKLNEVLKCDTGMFVVEMLMWLEFSNTWFFYRFTVWLVWNSLRLHW